MCEGRVETFEDARGLLINNLFGAGTHVLQVGTLRNATQHRGVPSGEWQVASVAFSVATTTTTTTTSFGTF